MLSLATTIQKKHLSPFFSLRRDGNSTTDPEAAVLGQPRLMPLGGSEENSGYKGFGLGMMVEVFSGILSGSLYGHTLGESPVL